VNVEIRCSADNADLLGIKTVNGRILSVESMIGELTLALRDEIDLALKERRRWLDSELSIKAKGCFPRWDERFSDADGNVRTFWEIVKGLIDNLHGLGSGTAWRLNDRVPVPEEVHPLRRPGLEITGPWHPLSRAIHQINSDVVTAFEDEEDASPAWYIPYGSGARCPAVWECRRTVKMVLSGNVPRPYVEKGKSYEIAKARSAWPAVFHRIPGIHLLDPYVIVEGRPAPAIIVSAVIYALNNYDELRRARSGIYFYVPKIMTPREALIVEKLMRRLEDSMGLRRGEIKVALLYEEGVAGLYLPVILWILRERLIKSSNGRWDYLGSLIEMWKDERVFPDPQNITMASPNMMAYQRYNALLMLMAGMKGGEAHAAPVGGMAAVMLYPKTDYYRRHRYNFRALRGIWLDKLRERLTGLIFLSDDVEVGEEVTLDDVLNGGYRGRLYDLFRQSWVATKEEEYVATGNAPLRSGIEELQQLIDAPVEYVEVDGVKHLSPRSGLTAEERGRFIELGLLTREGKIRPWVIRPSDLKSPEDLFSSRLWGGGGLWDALYAVPEGHVTIEHIQHAFFMAANYAFQILNGNLAAAIDDYELKQRFMNDLATYRIFTAWLWSLFRHRAPVTADGHLLGPLVTEDGVVLTRRVDAVRAGTRFDEALLSRVWELHYEWVRLFFREHDRVAAERVIESAGMHTTQEVVERVMGEVSRAYSAGPFREATPAQVAGRIAEMLGSDVGPVLDAVILNAPRFDRSKAPIAMEFLKKLITCPRYPQHNARLLFAVSEMRPDEAVNAINAVLGMDLVSAVSMVEEGKFDRRLLELYRYVYDLR